MFLDFDGSLSEIVERPELAEAAAGTLEALRALVATEALVAVVSGRRTDELTALLPVDGVEVFGQYGLPADAGFPAALRAVIDGVAAGLDGVRLEDKGASVAVHFRDARDPDAAGRSLEAALRPPVEGAGFRLLEGKRVWEAVPPQIPGKDHIVLREVRARGLSGAAVRG